MYDFSTNFHLCWYFATFLKLENGNRGKNAKTKVRNSLENRLDCVAQLAEQQIPNLKVRRSIRLVVNFFASPTCVFVLLKDNIFFAVYFFLASQGLNEGYSGRRIRI